MENRSDWNGTPIAKILPVEIASQDDRVNCDGVVLATREADHPLLAGLPWDERPPAIGGFNRFVARGEAQVLLHAKQFHVHRHDGNFQFEPGPSDPLLVIGSHGQGHTAALATDVAPHWVGPLVDWGTPRLTAQAPGAEQIEVGSDYARFFHQLLGWVGQLAE